MKTYYVYVVRTAGNPLLGDDYAYHVSTKRLGFGLFAAYNVWTFSVSAHNSREAVAKAIIGKRGPTIAHD